MNNKLKDILVDSGFDADSLERMGLMPFVQTAINKVINECATAAEHHARTYADGEAGSGAVGAANAVRYVGTTLGL